MQGVLSTACWLISTIEFSRLWLSSRRYPGTPYRHSRDHRVAPAVLAADGAVKSVAVELVELRLTGGMAGKALIILAGSVDAVKSALDYVKGV